VLRFQTLHAHVLPSKQETIFHIHTKQMAKYFKTTVFWNIIMCDLEGG